MRNDLKVKSILRKAGYPIIKYNKSIVIENGIEVIQNYGVVAINLRGLAKENEINKLLDNSNIEYFIFE